MIASILSMYASGMSKKWCYPITDDQISAKGVILGISAISTHPIRQPPKAPSKGTKQKKRKKEGEKNRLIRNMI